MDAATTTTGRKGRLDRIAMVLSAVCLVHCLATSVLVALVSSFGAVLGAPIVHEVALAVALALGVVALGKGTLEHRRFLPAAVGGLGLGIMTGALALPHGTWEAVATVAGVLVLAVGHYLNRLALA